MPPAGFEDYFGTKPYYRFMKLDEQKAHNVVDVLERIRDFPEGLTAEDTLRQLLPEGLTDAGDSVVNAIDFLYGIVDRDGPFDGIVGYSEGATIAATLLLNEQKRRDKEGRHPTFKCAIFFAGWPPMSPEADEIVYSDTSDLIIDIPSCHVGKRRF